MNPKVELILAEIGNILNQIDEKQLNSLVQDILTAERIVIHGAGRVGLACKAFGMRLSQLGLSAFSLDDSNIPNFGKKDLMIIASGSGETESVFTIVKIASNIECKIDVITSNPYSRIAKDSSLYVNIPAPAKIKRDDDYPSKQPLTTLFEQSLSLFFDSVVLILMEEIGETNMTMWSRHSNLE
jgi:6-phospho-3-hexuloisomerase